MLYQNLLETEDLNREAIWRSEALEEQEVDEEVDIKVPMWMTRQMKNLSILKTNLIQNQKKPDIV